MSSIPKPKKSSTKTLMSKCVSLSAKIATHSGICSYCGKIRSNSVIIDPHHIVPRNRIRTVARVDNQIPLCRYGCHRFAHDNPMAFMGWIDLKLPGRRLMLEAVARVQQKVDWPYVYSELEGQAKVLGIL